MAEAVDDSMDIEKLYEYGERLNDATDKSQHKTDYESIIAAANGSVKAKQLAAQLIPKFFKYFPQLSHQALDQHLYLCEDEELAVRVQAIRGLPLFCKDTPEYLSKIVDILAQLLVTSENVERDAVHKALMSLLRQDVKTSLTALLKHIGSTAEQNAEELTAWESIRGKVLCFIKDKVFPLKTELLRPQEEMERHITNLVKQNLQELLEIIEGQADLDAQFDRVFEMAKTSRPSTLAVYLYIPNIIGYIRVLMNVIGFTVCFQDKKFFSILYLISFVCDALDGWFARKFNQVSTFGAVLDMLTDRISTACLLVILSQVYRPGLIFLSLLALDIASHWLQMYSTFLVGKTSHKDVKDSSNWLLRAYYGSRKFMGYCCASCEVLYIMLFLLAENQNENLAAVLTSAARQPGINILLFVVLFGCIVKQLVNVIQMKTAADLCVLFDINKKK